MVGAIPVGAEAIMVTAGAIPVGAEAIMVTAGAIPVGAGAEAIILLIISDILITDTEVLLFTSQEYSGAADLLFPVVLLPVAQVFIPIMVPSLPGFPVRLPGNGFL